ncbi:hypothetical protein WG66_011015 [Moniliophthora roreri]|nr:hypothetical protein WG66_011015 [Moniliophthora roreri]
MIIIPLPPLSVLLQTPVQPRNSGPNPRTKLNTHYKLHLPTPVDDRPASRFLIPSHDPLVGHWKTTARRQPLNAIPGDQ